MACEDDILHWQIHHSSNVVTAPFNAVQPKAECCSTDSLRVSYTEHLHLGLSITRSGIAADKTPFNASLRLSFSNGTLQDHIKPLEIRGASGSYW